MSQIISIPVGVDVKLLVTLKDAQGNAINASQVSELRCVIYNNKRMHEKSDINIVNSTQVQVLLRSGQELTAGDQEVISIAMRYKANNMVNSTSVTPIIHRGWVGVGESPCNPLMRTVNQEIIAEFTIIVPPSVYYAGASPKIGPNGNFFVFNDTTKEYEDTGFLAAGSEQSIRDAEANRVLEENKRKDAEVQREIRLKEVEEKNVQLEQKANASDTPFIELTETNNAMKGVVAVELYAESYPKYNKFALLYLWKNSTTYNGQWCIRFVGWDLDLANWVVIGTWLQASYTPKKDIERIKIENAGYATVDWRLIPDGTSITSGGVIKKQYYKFRTTEYALGDNKGEYTPDWVYQSVLAANVVVQNVADFHKKQITLSYLWRGVTANKVNLIRFGHYSEDGSYNDNYFAYEWRGEIPNQKMVYQLKNGEIYIEIDWSKIDVGASWNGIVVVKNLLLDNSEGSSESYSVRDTTMQTVTVKKDGTGNYTSLQDAYAAIKDASFTNQYEVCVYPGVYEENNLIPPPFTHTHGLATNSVVITSKHLLGTTTLPVFDQRNGSSKLSNMLIESGTGYCIHYDVNLHKSTLVNENLHLRKLHYEGVMLSIIGGGSFKGGVLFHWKGCTFENGSAPCHTNANALNENTKLIFESCNFINAYPDLGSVGGFGHCICEITNCTFHLGSRGLNGWVSKMRNISDPTLYLYNNVEWQIIGGGNKNFAPMLFSSGKTIMIEADNNISISGSAADVLFSKMPTIVNKVGTSKATLTSLYYIADEQSGLPPHTSAADVVQMWKRLGDCSVANKTLTVTVGGVTRTHTFTNNYLASKESQSSILSKMQSSLSNCIIKSVEDGKYFYDNINTTEKIYVKALQNLAKGDFVGINGNKVTSTRNEPIAGIVCKGCVTGDYAHVWTSAFRFDKLYDQGYYSLDNQGSLIKSDNNSIGYIKNYIFYPSFGGN